MGLRHPQETELSQKWKVTVGAGDATPALVGDKLYVFTRQGENEVTLCLNTEDGSELWREEYAAQAATGGAARHPGPRSSPTVAGGKIITLGVGGILSCLDVATHKVVWRKDPFPKVVPRLFPPFFWTIIQQQLSLRRRTLPPMPAISVPNGGRLASKRFRAIRSPALAAENPALRQQLAVLQRSGKRPRLRMACIQSSTVIALVMRYLSSVLDNVFRTYGVPEQTPGSGLCLASRSPISYSSSRR